MSPWRGPRISCDRRILFSFQKNHLKMTFYTAWICLFMCPQHGHCTRGNIDCWVNGGRRRKNGSPQNEKGGGGTDVVLVEHKNNGAIAVGHCRYLNEHPITQVSVGLRQDARVPTPFWCYTSLWTQPMSNFTAAARWLRPWDNDASSGFLLALLLPFSQSSHRSILDLSTASIH